MARGTFGRPSASWKGRVSTSAPTMPSSRAGAQSNPGRSQRAATATAAIVTMASAMPMPTPVPSVKRNRSIETRIAAA